MFSVWFWSSLREYRVGSFSTYEAAVSAAYEDARLKRHLRKREDLEGNYRIFKDPNPSLNL
jgi:hypothetical protein